MQKLRVCSSGESTFRIGLLVTLFFSNCLSLAASLQLNRISDYVKMYRATHKFLWCFTSDPIMHRSAIFTLVKADQAEDHETLKDMMQNVKNKVEMINRPNSKGDSPLHAACHNNSPTPAALLIKNGAHINQNNSAANSPLHIACENNDVRQRNLLDSRHTAVQLVLPLLQTVAVAASDEPKPLPPAKLVDAARRHSAAAVLGPRPVAALPRPDGAPGGERL